MLCSFVTLSSRTFISRDETSSAKFKHLTLLRNYLGSINHTLLSIEMLKSRGIENIKIIFSGDEHQSTEQAIQDHSGIEVLGRIEQEPYFDKNVVLEYAEKWKEKLCKK